jgi:hypothetical protein
MQGELDRKHEHDHADPYLPLLPHGALGEEDQGERLRSSVCTCGVSIVDCCVVVVIIVVIVVVDIVVDVGVGVLGYRCCC